MALHADDALNDAPLIRPQLALSEAEGTTLSRRERVSACRYRFIEILLPPGEGARRADEGRAINSVSEGLGGGTAR
jgi:hypothetical protein